jgi:hypothetical protein
VKGCPAAIAIAGATHLRTVSSTRQSQQSRLELGCVATINSNGKQSLLQMRTATMESGYIVHAEELLTAFVELESAAEPFSASSFL